MSAIRTTCAYCGVGCGILATPTGARTVEIKGDPDHPANAGRLCSKGTPRISVRLWGSKGVCCTP